MPEYRYDFLTDSWVIIAEERANRPNQFECEIEIPKVASLNKNDETSFLFCPFCPGNESETPSETVAFREIHSEKNTPNWKIRVVPNRYPAVCEKIDENPAAHEKYKKQIKFSGLDFGKTFSCAGFGKHEVIIETPRHLKSFSQLNDDEIRNVFLMYRQRVQELRAEKKWAYVIIFKNVGVAAGASLPHSHSQIVAMPFVPPSISNELRNAISYYQKHRQCYWCNMIQKEIATHSKQKSYDGFKSRVILETEQFLLFCPFTSRFSLEMSILPKQHISHFESLNNKMSEELAFLVQEAIIRLEKTDKWDKHEPSYNIILKSAPFPEEIFSACSTGKNQEIEDYYHFSVSILPALTKAAGFEWGTDIHINSVSPETAAVLLRCC
jgi:UDPglucose--hexose-1-phosphate uridylyltransferase